MRLAFLTIAPVDFEPWFSERMSSRRWFTETINKQVMFHKRSIPGKTSIYKIWRICLNEIWIRMDQLFWIGYTKFGESTTWWVGRVRWSNRTFFCMIVMINRCSLLGAILRYNRWNFFNWLGGLFNDKVMIEPEARVRDMSCDKLCLL